MVWRIRQPKIHPPHPIALVLEKSGQMVADKASSAGDENLSMMRHHRYLLIDFSLQTFC